MVVDAQNPFPGGLCLRGYEPGTSDIGVTWGDAAAQTTVTVQ